MKVELISYSLLATLFSLCCVGACIRGKETAETYPVAKFNKMDFAIPCTEFPLERATTYWCSTEQCDSNPYTTADGSIIDPANPQRWVALSWDLIFDEERQGIYDDTTLWRGDFRFGDTIEVYSNKHPKFNGSWVVHDVMSSEWRMSIDFLIHPKNNKPKLGVGTDIKIIYCGNN